MKNGKSIWKGLCCNALLSVAFTLLVTNVAVYATPSDNIIESAAKGSYIFKNYLHDESIVVESKYGTVTLTGTVSEEFNKVLAQDIIESIVGVVVVDNQLQIKTAIVKTKDAVIFSRVRLAILSLRQLRGIDVGFTVENGIVSITGMALNTAQIDLTTEYIKDVEGVKEVKNVMGVIKSQPEVEKTLGGKVGDVGEEIGCKSIDINELIDDGSITVMVKAALTDHRSTSAINTKVGTNDGVVTLSGTAKNEAARELATKFAQDVRGVRGVVNTMVLEITE